MVSASRVEASSRARWCPAGATIEWPWLSRWPDFSQRVIPGSRMWRAWRPPFQDSCGCWPRQRPAAASAKSRNQTNHRCRRLHRPPSWCLPLTTPTGCPVPGGFGWGWNRHNLRRLWTSMGVCSSFSQTARGSVDAMTSGKRGPVIAIDGPVGAGKSTAARRLAEALGSVHMDSGAMYRAMAWKAIQAGIDLRDHANLARLAAQTDVRVMAGPSGPRVLVDSTDVTDALRTPVIDEASSLVSTCLQVRERMVALQRAMAKEGGVVMDGRDIGTVVFPDADLKFYLDADLSVRASRRLGDLRHAGADADLSAVEVEVARRDERDRERGHSPLRAAADAVRINSTHLA